MDELLGALPLPPRVWACIAWWQSSSSVLCCSFCLQDPTWRLPVSGHVVDLVTANDGALREAFVDGAAQEVLWG